MSAVIWVAAREAYRPAIDASILELRDRSIDNVMWAEINYRNNREQKHSRFPIAERLVACVSPGSPRCFSLFVLKSASR